MWREKRLRQILLLIFYDFVHFQIDALLFRFKWWIWWKKSRSIVVLQAYSYIKISLPVITPWVTRSTLSVWSNCAKNLLLLLFYVSVFCRYLKANIYFKYQIQYWNVWLTMKGEISSLKDSSLLLKTRCWL